MKVWKLGTLVALFATVLAGCSKDAGMETTDPIEVAPGHRVITVKTFEENADADSRTQLKEDGTGVQWDENDVLTLVELAYNGTEELSRMRKDSESISIGADNKATFSFDFAAAQAGATKYVYRAIKVFRDIDLNDDDNLDLPDNANYYVKNSQNPTDSSFDPQADLLIAKQQVFDTPQSSLSFQFARGVAITRMTLKGLQPGEDVRAVSFYTDSDTGTPIVGKVTHNYSGIDADAECSLDVDTDVADYDNYRVTMVYDDEEADENGHFPVYFVTLPVTLTKTITVHVITTERHYLKTVNVAGRNFELKLDCLNKFNLDLTDCIEPSTENTFVLVTDPDDLEVNNQIIITTNFGVDSEVTNYALAGPSSDYRLGEMVDKGDDVNTIETTSENTAIITLVAGTKTGSFALRLPNGKYLAHVDTGNTLNEVESITDAASWYITYDEEHGGMSILSVAATDDSPFRIRYNKTANPARFACYKSDISAGIPLVDVYKYMIPAIKAADMIAIGVAGGEDQTTWYAAVNIPNDVRVIDYDKTVVTAASASNGVVTYTVAENTSTESRDGYITLGSESIPDNIKNIIVRQAPHQGSLTQGAAYTFTTSTQDKFSAWNTAKTYNSMSWTLTKVSGESNAAINNSMDSNGRGQTIGSAKSGVTVVTETGTGYNLYCDNQTAQGISTVSVKCCAKSGTAITVAVSVGGTPMTTTQATQTISGSNSSAVATFDFTSTTLLTGDVVITYTLGTAGALYLHTVEINGDGTEPEPDPVKLDTPTNLSATATGKDVTVTWTAVANAASYNVVCGASNTTVTTTTASFTMPAYNTTYDVSVVAVPADGDSDHLNSNAATTSVTTGDDPNAGGGGETVYYEKVVADQDDWSGQYLIVSDDGAAALDGSRTTLDAQSNLESSLTISANKIEATARMDAISFTISSASSGYYIKSASGKYMGCHNIADSKNGLHQADAASADMVNTITFSTTDNTVAIVGATGKHTLTYYSQSGSERFRYYSTPTGTSKVAITLYKKQGTGGSGSGNTDPTPEKLGTPTGLSASANGKDVTVTWTAVANAAKYNVVCGASSSTVTTTTASFTMPAYSTTYDVSVVAVPADSDSAHLNSDPATTNVTTGNDPNGGGVTKGATWTATISTKGGDSNSWGKIVGSNASTTIAAFTNKSVTLNDMSWIMSVTSATSGGNIQFAQQQIGTSSNDIGNITLSTENYSGGIQAITVSTCSNSTTATLTVRVNGVQLGTTQTINDSNPATYTFSTANSSTLVSGPIELLWNNTTTGKYIKISEICINPEN